MATVGSILTNLGKKIILNRAYKVTPDYTSPSRFKVGVDSSVPNIGDVDLNNPIPITNGIIYDGGDKNMTGKHGGLDTTNNTTTYKDGAGTTDVTSQNLLTTTTSGSKTWYLDSGSMNSNVSGTQDNCGLWLYIKNTTTYNYFKSSGTAVEVRLGSGTADDYYKFGKTRSQLNIGWNWLTSGTAVVNLNSVGTPTDASMDSFVLQVLTNNDSDTWSSGDVIYDLLRGWKRGDEFNSWTSASYPSVNESTFTVEMRGQLSTTQANGFNIDSFGDFNSGTMMAGKDVFTAESKSSTDQFTFVVQDRLI